MSTDLKVSCPLRALNSSLSFIYTRDHPRQIGARKCAHQKKRINNHAFFVKCTTPNIACSTNCAQISPKSQRISYWHELENWRSQGLNNQLVWGAGTNGCQTDCNGYDCEATLSSSLVECGLQVLNTASPEDKAAVTHQAWAAYLRGEISLHPNPCDPIPAIPSFPARPPLPQLVPAKQIPSYKKEQPFPLASYTLLNLAHVELNAVELAWDTVIRFSPLQLPDTFYEDFARVAADEGRHLGWCLQRLRELGHPYGSLPAHNLLWEGGVMSAGDVGARLAIVPLSQEARGLDAGERLVHKLRAYNDKRSADIVAKIAEEERAHVAVGVYWFERVCEALEVEPGAEFRNWLLRLCPDLLKGPFNHAERARVGMPRDWYDTSQWPEEEQSLFVAASEEMRKQARSETPRRASAAPLADPRLGVEQAKPGTTHHAATTSLDNLQNLQLELLRGRLATVLDVEYTGLCQNNT